MAEQSVLVDRISDLPDSILGLILSRLHTRKAVATSILSKLWRFKWVTIHTLNLCCYNDEGDNTEFIRFVNRVLLLHDAGFLYKFRLEWKHDFVPSLVSSWISTVITKNVNNLSLSLGNRRFCRLYHPVCVSFFSCVSLRSLKLDGGIFVPAATVFCLPTLESLKLASVDFESEETFEKLINGCSVLDDLHISNGGGFTYRIFSTSLRSLTFISNCKLKLEASSLQFLKFHGDISAISVPNFSSLVEAEFDVGCAYDLSEAELSSKADECNSIVEALRALNCAKFLTLSIGVMEALRCATMSLSTEFKRLVKLYLEIECCPWSLSLDFIQNSDNLEDLTIDLMVYEVPYDSDIHDHHSDWTSPVEVPRCLSNSLKKVNIRGYKGMEDEHGMIPFILYMLQHGSVLEVIEVYYRGVGDGEMFELLQKICESPKKSSACEVTMSNECSILP